MSDHPSDEPTAFEAQISQDVLFRELAGEAVLLDLKSQRYFGLDPVATRIWQLLDEQRQTDRVLRAMLDEFEVEEAQLRKDLDGFLRELTDAGLIELRRLGADRPEAART